MKRYAFIKDDDPAYAPKIGVAIVQQDGPPGTAGEVIDFNIVADKAELNAYLNAWLGVDRPVKPIYKRNLQ